MSELAVPTYTHPIMPLQDNILGPIPIAILHSRLQVRLMMPVEIGEDTVLIL